MKNDIFEKVVNEERRIWEAGRKSEYYEKYGSVPSETKDAATKVRLDNGCPSVEVLRAYNQAKEWNSEMLIIESFWSSEIENLLKTLETGNIKEFYLTDASSGLMGEIHALTNAGWKLEPITIKHPYYKHTNFETNEMEQDSKMALRFTKEA